MSKTLLFDYNNLAFRTIFVKDVGITTPQPDYQIWRYLTFNAIYQALHAVPDTTEIILALDDSNPWRRAYFPRYKESRSKTRVKKDDVNWKELYNNLMDLADDIKKHIPFKVILSTRAEADDVIAVIAKNLDHDCSIISNDEDFKQLISKRIQIYNPRKKEYVQCDDTDKFIVTKCLTGQAKDDIFNVKTPSDWGQTPETEGKRKPGFGPKGAEKVLKEGYEKWLEDNNLTENFKRNRILMDFNYIPEPIISNIMKQYNSYEFPDADNIYKFFAKNHFKGFVDEFTFVENRLMQLY